MKISSDDDRGGCDVEDGESAIPISSGTDEIDEHQPSRSRSHSPRRSIHSPGTPPRSPMTGGSTPLWPGHSESEDFPLGGSSNGESSRSAQQEESSKFEPVVDTLYAKGITGDIERPGEPVKSFPGCLGKPVLTLEGYNQLAFINEALARSNGILNEVEPWWVFWAVGEVIKEISTSFPDKLSILQGFLPDLKALTPDVNITRAWVLEWLIRDKVMIPMSDKHADWAAQDPVEPEDLQLGLNACAEIANLNNHLSMPGR